MPKYKVGERFFFKYPTSKSGRAFLHEQGTGIVEITYVLKNPNGFTSAFGDFDYQIKCITHNCVATDGHCCSEGDLIPMNDMSKAIYGK